MKYLRLTSAALLLGALALALSAQSAAQAGGNTVKLKLQLPNNDGKVSVDGKNYKGTGSEREFTVPVKGDTITVKYVWEPNGYTKITRTRTAKAAGAKDTIVVDLREASKEMPDDIVVIYVPTPDDIVEAMCKLGKVTKDDIVYDLGCGDGRMVITAVEKFHAKRGVGVDINKKLVEECKENAKKRGVSERVEFRVGDVLKIKDLADATVVLLYMGDDINNRLKPILQSTLKPGARVVSHRFRMGEWEPTKTETVTGANGGQYELHLWVIGDKKK